MIRLDQALVERGLCESRERAKRAILAGQIRINAQPARKPSDSVKPDDALTLDMATTNQPWKNTASPRNLVCRSSLSLIPMASSLSHKASVSLEKMVDTAPQKYWHS